MTLFWKCNLGSTPTLANVSDETNKSIKGEQL